MPGVSISDFGASFIKYLPGVKQTLNNTVYARNIPKGKMDWEGERLEWRVHVKRNPAVSNIEDGGAFPIAGKQSYVPAYAYRKFCVGSVQVTDGALTNAATTKNAAISVVESELTGMMDGIKKYQNGTFSRDGTGVVATVGTTASGATITVSDARMLWDGKDYEIRDVVTPATIHVPSFVVSRVARAPTAANEATVTPTAAIGALGQVTGDYIVWGTGGSSSYGRAITGLDALIDDAATTFQGVDCSVYTRYTSPVLGNLGTPRALTPSLFRQMLATIKQEAGEDPPDGMTVMGPVFEAINLEELYEGDLRITPDTTTAGIAVSSFQSVLGRINIVTDPDAPYGKLFFLDPSQLVYAVQAELDWRRDAPGASIFKRSDTFAGYTATAIETCELAIMERNRCGKIEDLTEARTTAY